MGNLCTCYPPITLRHFTEHLHTHALRQHIGAYIRPFKVSSIHQGDINPLTIVSISTHNCAHTSTSMLQWVYSRIYWRFTLSWYTDGYNHKFHVKSRYISVDAFTDLTLFRNRLHIFEPFLLLSAIHWENLVRLSHFTRTPKITHLIQ
jgi:hypothetical protein